MDVKQQQDNSKYNVVKRTKTGLREGNDGGTSYRELGEPGVAYH